jgi:hypothetical protein
VTKKYRIIIAGGRSFANEKYYDKDGYKNGRHWRKDEQKAFRQLSALLFMVDYADVEIVSGGAQGADALGERFAEWNGTAVKKFPADWDKHGKAAGHIRNREMGDYANEEGYVGRLIEFWDGESKGSKGMIDYASSISLKTRIIKYD